jgi:hypothetical protein
MRFLCLVALALGSAPATAADLSKIDRTIAKEPAYKNKPLYALLVFGPEARAKVWVVLDGDVLYVDQKGDGDLTAPGVRFPNRGEGVQSFVIADQNGKDRYRVTSLHLIRLDKEAEWLLAVDVDVIGTHAQYCGAVLKGSRREAPIAHFDGPLKVSLNENKGVVTDRLVTGDNPGELRAFIGTIDPDHGCWVVVRNSSARDFPANLHPVAEVEFPPMVPGGQPVRRRYELKERC